MPMNDRFGTTNENPINLLEDLTLNGWPSLQVLFDDGWVLRFANGYTGRANSVHPLGGQNADVQGKISRCEAWYTARKLATRFKLTPASHPSDLDDLLRFHSYREVSGASVQRAALDNLPEPEQLIITMSDAPLESWMSNYCTMKEIDFRHLPTMRQMFANHLPPTCFATIFQAGEPAAMGLAVAERGHVGLYDIIVAEKARRRGLGKQICLHLLNWGKSKGAHHAYLQVIPDNEPALRLYEGLGFKEVYQYWYRVKETP